MRVLIAIIAIIAFYQTADARPRHHRHHRAYDAGQVIGARPAGCPRRYCACRLALDIFGRVIPKLNLAANWARLFPRTSPAPGMVAARSGHAFRLLSHVRGSVWVAMDPNSGRGLTRIHQRSIAGFAIVNPYGSMNENHSYQREAKYGWGRDVYAGVDARNGDTFYHAW